MSILLQSGYLFYKPPQDKVEMQQLWKVMNDINKAFVNGEISLQQAIAAIPIAPVVNTAITIVPIAGNHTFTETDFDNKLLRVTGVSQLLIPEDTTEDITVGKPVKLSPTSAAYVDVTIEAGVTLLSKNDLTRLDGKDSVAEAMKIAANTWLLWGDLKITLDPDAEAYMDAMVAASGITIPELHMTAFDNAFKGVKGDGVYPELAWWPCYGGVYNAGKFNAINPLDSDAALRLTDMGAGTSIWDAQGVSGNASNIALNTHLSPDMFTQDSSWIGFINKASINAGFDMYGRVGSVGIGFISRQGGNLLSDHYNNGTNRVTVANASSIGQYNASRTSSIVHKAFKDSAQIGATNTNASVSLVGSNAAIALLALNTSGTLSNYSGSKLNQVRAGLGKTDAQIALFDARMLTLNSALGM